jgi:hypothetical protein
MSESKSYVINAAEPTEEEKKMLEKKEIINDEKLEMQWAVSAYKHAEVYMNLIKSIDPTKLRLTPFLF